MPKRQAKQERKKNQQKSVNPVHHRCNFLLQAADLLSSASSSTASNLAAKFGKLAKECQKKGLIKLHPYSKRIICKKCHQPLFRFFGSNEKKIGQNSLPPPAKSPFGCDLFKLRLFETIFDLESRLRTLD